MLITSEYRTLLQTIGARHWVDAHRMCKAWAESTLALKCSAQSAADPATRQSIALG